MIGMKKKLCRGAAKAALLMLLVVFMGGCESMYYDMVMDKSDTKAGKEKDDSLERASNLNRLGSYR